MRAGNGWEAESQHGSQVSQEQLDTIMHYIDAGKKEGATLVTGGSQVHIAFILLACLPCRWCSTQQQHPIRSQ